MLPTWYSLALDYLAIMASSVSSERAFSSAGVTITKRRNRLGAEVVEALQGLKISIRNDLLVRAQPLTLQEEEEYFSDDAKTVGSGAIVELDLDDDKEVGLRPEHPLTAK